jgi:hypothetical protein
MCMCVYICIYTYIHAHIFAFIYIYIFLLSIQLSNVVICFFPYHSGKASFSEICSTLPVIQSRWANHHFTWCNLTLMIFLSFEKLCYLLINLFSIIPWVHDSQFSGMTAFSFWVGVSWTFCLTWPQTAVLLILASQVARIVGMSHWHLAVILIAN